MKKIIRLTESDLARIVRRVINEDTQSFDITNLKKEDIKSIRFLDGKGRDILESFTVENGGLIVKINDVNFVNGEKTQLRILVDKRIIFTEEQRGDVKISKRTDGTLVYIDNVLKGYIDNINQGKKSNDVIYVVKSSNLRFNYMDINIKFSNITGIDFGL